MYKVRQILHKLLLIAGMSMLLAGCNYNVSPDEETTSVETELFLDTSLNYNPSLHMEMDKETSNLEVHFLDVGQGDSTLIISDSHAMLIDCGESAKGTWIQNYLKKQGIEKLDYLILTHPDSDHIGGAPVIITKFEIENVFMSDFVKNTSTYEKVLQSLTYKNLSWNTPDIGSKYTLGDAEFTILSPSISYEDANNSSIEILLTNGTNTFLFTGDAEEQKEKDTLKENEFTHIDVYKAGHHGSKTSSSEGLLSAITPTYTVISCGEENDYGHPHSEVLNRLRQYNSQVFRTDEQGTVVAVSDGENITWNCAPSETWQSGEAKGKTETITQTTLITEDTAATYICNTNSMKIHLSNCESVAKISEKNKWYTNDSKESLLKQGYAPCKICNP